MCLSHESKLQLFYPSLFQVFSVRRFDSDEITPTAYFSGQLSNSLPDGCIGLNPVYARLLNIPEKLSVCVSEVTHFVSVAKASITPLTPDDYDILVSSPLSSRSIFFSFFSVIQGGCRFLV